MQPASAERWAWSGAAALAVALGIGRFVYTPILPAMVAALHLDAATAGWIASANYVGYLAGALVASAIPRTRAAFVTGLVASVLTTAAMGTVAEPVLFMLLRAAGGIASALVLVCGSRMVLAALQLHHRSGLSALHFAGVGIGIALSAVLVATLDAAGVGWQGLWYASGLAAFIASLVSLALLPRGDIAAPDRNPTQAPALAHVRTRLLWAYGLFGFGYVITATFLVVEVRASEPVIEPVVWVIVGLAAAPSIAVWNAVAARTGLVRAFAAASLTEAVGVAASVLVPGAAGAVIAAALLGATFMGLTALGLSMARQMSAKPEQMVGLMTASFGTGQIIGPLFGGQATAITGSFTLPTLVAAAALVLGAVLAWIA